MFYLYQVKLNMYDLNDKTYNKPIIYHMYKIDYDAKFDLSRLYY